MEKNAVDAQKMYLDFLRDLFKDRVYVSLAYLTGILPIKKYGTHSALNMFDEYSMMDPYELAEYVGFTEEEVNRLCKSYGLDFSEVKSWYDGYVFDGDLHVYNPKSLSDLIQRKKYKSYWTETETYEALKLYFHMNFDGLKEAIVTMLGNGSIPVKIRTFQNDMTTFKSKDDVLALLVHLGYLAYDGLREEVYIPNKEIADEFLNAIDDRDWGGVIQAIDASERLLEATLQMDADTVAEKLDVIHAETTSLLAYNDENSLSCSIFMAYYSAKKDYLPPIREFPSGKGFADVVYLPKKEVDKPALLIELKWNKTAEGAVAQIKEKRYMEWLENYTGEILLVAVNYDRAKKEHSCIIERYMKK